METVKVNSVYRHFKGKYVYVVEIASDSDTLEDVVIYRHIGEEKLWTRKSSMFLESIDEQGENNITRQRKRFELVSDLEDGK